MAALEVADRALDRRQHLASAIGRPSWRRSCAIASRGMWLPLVNSTSGRPDARIASSTSAAPAEARRGRRRRDGRACHRRRTRTRAPRRRPSSDSVPSAATAPDHGVIALDELEQRRSRRRSRELVQQRHERRAATGLRTTMRGRLSPWRAAWLSGLRGVRASIASTCSRGHRQAQQQLLVGDPRAEAPRARPRG